MLTLRLVSPIVSPSAANYELPSWPPKADSPVVVDAAGRVISRFSDPVWDLSAWALKPMRLYFGDAPASNRRSFSLSKENADALRLLSAWWLWGPQAVTTATTLKTRFSDISPLFLLCSREGISATALARFPSVADKIPSVTMPSAAGDIVTLLHDLYEQRGELGFTLLDREGLRRLVAAMPAHTGRQTAYIPPRIWLYQLMRLRAFLDDFKTHREALEACYLYCLESYESYFGSLSGAFRPATSRRGCRSPFARRGRKLTAEGRAFSDVAREFGIDGLLHRWIVPEGESIDSAGRSVTTLSSYFTATGKVGIAYLLNFSMMRIDEAWNLRTDCLDVENDARLGTFYTLKGSTSKTIADRAARWITAPSVTDAVAAMKFVSDLRMIAAAANPMVPKDTNGSPYLVTRHYEPWASTKNCDRPPHVRPQYASYQDVLRTYPKLLDLGSLRITSQDLNQARAITPSLDPSIYAVGNVWPLSWHQLRRTGAVNMQASGLVSDSSVQYQLKHASRAMSLYYGQGYSHVRLNEPARSEFLRTMYEVLAKDIVRLFTDRYVSPFGSRRKADILRLVDASDLDSLERAARSGAIAWRETLLGGCTHHGPCPFGGVDNVVHCAGGEGRKPCPDALFDREKKLGVETLRRAVAIRLVSVQPDSPTASSLRAQIQALDTTLRTLDGSDE